MIFQPIKAHVAKEDWVTVLHPTAYIRWDDIDLDFEALCADTKFRGALTMTRSITQLYIDWNDSALEKLAHTKALLQAELGIEPELAEPE